MAFYANAQAIDKMVIANGGEAMTNGEVHVNTTIGEPLIGMVLNDFSIDQGFWAGSLLVEPMLPEEELHGMVIFPNPVEEELSLFTGNNRVIGLTMFSVDGRMVFRKRVDESLTQHQIDARMLANGMYVLQVVIEGSSKEKLFKVVKK
jgi:hypothetical protein